MTTRTDYQSILELQQIYSPAQRGIVSSDEMEQIRAALELEQRTMIELNNIRDMTVLIYNVNADRLIQEKQTSKAMQCMDAMSAITCVIDQEKWNRGGITR